MRAIPSVINPERLPSVRELRQKCLTNGTGFENVPEKRLWLELYHLRNTMALLGKDRHFSPSASRGSVTLVNQTNCTENLSRFSKNGKKVIARKIFLSFRKISTGINCSIWILPGITGISIQMVSAPYNLDVNFKQSKEWQKNWIPRFSVSNHLKICQNLLLTEQLWKKKIEFLSILIPPTVSIH